MWIGKLGDHTYLSMPTDGGLSLVAVCPSIERRAEVRSDREAVFGAGLRAWPELHAGVDGATREGPLRTMASLNGFFRPSAGPGWVLVGDAGHFKDPTAGQGISDALRQSERLATTIAGVFGDGPDELDAALRGWWRWRDEDAWEMYWFARDLGAAGPTPPLFREANRRIATDPGMTAGMTRILNQDVRPSEVITPSFALATVAGAFRQGRGHRRALTGELLTTATDEFRRWRASP
jgi:2-polyprenyl-6-methoxyphenol hydroxylase-like FAD-dependent oxidoreductase